MSATYTFDVFTSLDGFGVASGDWTGYWGKQGPELLAHRLAVYEEPQRMVFGANTFSAGGGHKSGPICPNCFLAVPFGTRRCDSCDEVVA